jgi:hypothetical protein
MKTIWKCGHDHTPKAPDFDPVADAQWCAEHDCPPCRRRMIRQRNERDGIGA